MPIVVGVEVYASSVITTFPDAKTLVALPIALSIVAVLVPAPFASIEYVPSKSPVIWLNEASEPDADAATAIVPPLEVTLPVSSESPSCT